VPFVNIQAFTSPEEFAVCLVLEADAFQLIVGSKNLEMTRAIQRFKAQRYEHRMEAAHASTENHADVVARDEGTGFARSNRNVIRWASLTKKIIKNDSRLWDSTQTRLHTCVVKAKSRKSVFDVSYDDVSYDDIQLDLQESKSCCPVTGSHLPELKETETEISSTSNICDIEVFTSLNEMEEGAVKENSLERIEALIAKVLKRMDLQDTEIQNIKSLISSMRNHN